jgi:hypothetical protein
MDRPFHGFGDFCDGGFRLWNGIRACRPSTNQSEADDKIPTSKSPRAIPKRTGPDAGAEPEAVWILRGICRN